MQSTILPPPRKSGGAAPAAGPPLDPKPAGDSGPPVVHSYLHALASTRMMADGRAIRETARDLIAQLEAFLAAHTGESIVSEMRGVGLSRSRTYLRHIAANMLYDATGGIHMVELFTGTFGSELLDADAGLPQPAPKSR